MSTALITVSVVFSPDRSNADRVRPYAQDLYLAFRDKPRPEPPSSGNEEFVARVTFTAPLPTLVKTPVCRKKNKAAVANALATYRLVGMLMV
ncbi:hypothetical protein [Methylorubrum aminovorans]